MLFYAFETNRRGFDCGTMISVSLQLVKSEVNKFQKIFLALPLCVAPSVREIIVQKKRALL